jgi:phytoene/squalene synthetase
VDSIQDQPSDPNTPATTREEQWEEQERAASAATRDIADVPAVEVITTTAVHLLSAAAVKTGLADNPEQQTDLDEARKLINALAGLITAAAPEISDMHARSLRDGLRSVQLAFREASVIQDPIGKGPGEKWTGPVT